MKIPTNRKCVSKSNKQSGMNRAFFFAVQTLERRQMLSASISGTVTNDLTYSPIPGAQIYLDLQGVGKFVAGDPTATTNASGQYTFTGLNAANYLVRPLPGNYQVIANPVWGGKHFVPLAANQVVTGVDFAQHISTTAWTLPAPGGGTYFLEFHSIGPNVLVTRYNGSDGSTDVTFGSLGSVFLPIDVNSLSGNAFSAASDAQFNTILNFTSSIVTLSPARVILSVTSVNRTISGTVYDDANNNGILDGPINGQPAEAGVAGRTVYLDLLGLGHFVNGDPIAITDANGRYTYTSLSAANYLVQLVPLGGTFISSPVWGGKFFVQLGNIQNITGEDFGTEALSDPALKSITQTDGKILVARSEDKNNDTSVVVLTRYNSEGIFDTGFGTIGSVRLPQSTGLDIFNTTSSPTQLTLMADGSVVVLSRDMFTKYFVNTTVARLSRVDADGKIAGSVEVASYFTTPGGTAGGDQIASFAVTTDNRIIVAGNVVALSYPGPDFISGGLIIKRYHADLTPDTSFNLASLPTQFILIPTGIVATSDGGVDVSFAPASSDIVHFSNTGQWILAPGQLISKPTHLVETVLSSYGYSSEISLTFTGTGTESVEYRIRTATMPAGTSLPGILKQTGTNQWTFTAIIVDYNGGPTLIVDAVRGALAVSSEALPFASVNTSQIAGTIFYDLNENGIQENSESGKQNRNVYLDLNGSGKLDFGEPIQLTDADGNYAFSNLPAGNYVLRLTGSFQEITTVPLFGGKHYVQLGTNQFITEKNFGTSKLGSPNLELPDHSFIAAIFSPGPYKFNHYNFDGSIDTSYGTLGTADTQFNATFGGINQFLNRPDGKLIVRVNTGTHSSTSDYLQLFDATGTLQKTTQIASQVQGQQGIDTINNIAIQADNKILLNGQHDDPSPNHYRFQRRYNADLSLDTTFGLNGQLLV